MLLPQLFAFYFLRNLVSHNTNGTKSGIIWGDGIVSEFGMDMYTLSYLKWVTTKDLLYSTGNSAQCYVAAQMGEELGKNGYVCTYG